jgi:hypothetical protein
MVANKQVAIAIVAASAKALRDPLTVCTGGLLQIVMISPVARRQVLWGPNLAVHKHCNPLIMPDVAFVNRSFFDTAAA